MRRLILVVAALLVSNSLVWAAAPASGSAPGEPVRGSTSPLPPAAAKQLDPNVFRCGPIHCTDPATRAQIERLYREEFDLRQSTLAQLRDLAQRAQSITDSAEQMELNKQGGALKQSLERRHMELGLQIARLNGDMPLAAEFEVALDQLLHPEKYLVVPPASERAHRPPPTGVAK